MDALRPARPDVAVGVEPEAVEHALRARRPHRARAADTADVTPCGDLDRVGAQVWLDVAAIPAGVKWSTAVQQGLDTCQIMLVIISPDSMASRNVEDEWHSYLDDGKTVIPIWWRPARVHFQLRRIQHVDFHEQDYAAAFEQLRQELADLAVMAAGRIEAQGTPAEVFTSQNLRSAFAIDARVAWTGEGTIRAEFPQTGQKI